ncbi:MAG: hypothetical protein RBT45_08640 [Acholeplasmataceae bacterium]|jgi:hypothetical protein|nr:hypothetical protein [Acholeplasmataceae bacterium]
MKKLILILIAIAMVAFTAQSTYAYTFIDDNNAIASDSPYAITYTTEELDETYDFIRIKIAPTPGYNFFGSYVINLINIYDDERLADYTTLYMDGFIGTFPNQIPNFVSAAVVEQYSSTNTLKQSIPIATYQGDPAVVSLRFNQIANYSDYYVITVVLDTTEYNAADYVNSLLPDGANKKIEISTITEAQYQSIFQEGYDEAVFEIGAEYDLLIAQILELEEYIEDLELQLQITPEETGTNYTSVDFLEANIIYVVLALGATLLVGVKLGSLKKRRYKNFR